MTGAILQSLERIGAVVMRHVYILRKSPARIVEVMYWPAMTMILWGFVSRYFAAASDTPATFAFATLLGCVLMWDVLFRTQISVSISYLEELWARNMGHLFVSPLRTAEWWAGVMVVAVLRMLVGFLPAAVLAVPFYGFSLFDLGWPLLAFFANLVLMGWWLGFLIVALLMRAGPGAEGLAWMIAFGIAPFCAVYYPVEILPAWMQTIGRFIPAAHVFEGLRELAEQGIFNKGLMLKAFLLNLAYTAVAAAVVGHVFRLSRRDGTLLQSGE